MKNWSLNIYEFSSDLLLGLLYVLCYRDGISFELKYEAILALITTTYVALGFIFLFS